MIKVLFVPNNGKNYHVHLNQFSIYQRNYYSSDLKFTDELIRWKKNLHHSPKWKNISMCPNDNVYILIRFSNRTNKETFYKNVPLKNPKNKKKEKSLLSFKFSNVFKIAPPLDNSSGVAEKQIQSFSKPSKTLNLDACFGFKITRHLRRDQKKRDFCKRGCVAKCM